MVTLVNGKVDERRVAIVRATCRQFQGRNTSSGLGGMTVCPRGVFAVVGVVAEAAVQDADESITEGA